MSYKSIRRPAGGVVSVSREDVSALSVIADAGVTGAKLGAAQVASRRVVALAETSIPNYPEVLKSEAGRAAVAALVPAFVLFAMDFAPDAVSGKLPEGAEDRLREALALAITANSAVLSAEVLDTLVNFALAAASIYLVK